jgi:TonB family protein
MKRVWFLLVAGGILAHALLFAQLSGNVPQNPPAYENGSLADNTYTNECFGLSLPIPDGWQVNSIGANGKAIHLSGGNLVLLMIRQPKEGSSGNGIGLTARDPSALPPTTEAFVSNFVHAQINADPQHRELLRDAYTVDYGGRNFVRSDYKQALNGHPLYLALVFTKFRGYYIGEMITAGLQEGLEESAKSLQHISFRNDEPEPKCVMKGNDNSSGIISGIISSSPGPSSGGRVRVSQKVSQGLLAKKVPPHYPDDARQARIQGQVVLQAIIDTNGDVKDLSLVSGHPMLAPAAIDAVKHWKYKPYLLNGLPVEVETQIVVNFQLFGY